MGRRNESDKTISIGRVFVIGDRYFLSLEIKSGDRLVSLRDRKADIRKPGGEEEEVKEGLSVEDLCACWRIPVEFLDAWVVERVYSWRADWQAGIQRGTSQGWTNCLDRGEARGRLFGLDAQ